MDEEACRLVGCIIRVKPKPGLCANRARVGQGRHLASGLRKIEIVGFENTLYDCGCLFCTCCGRLGHGRLSLQWFELGFTIYRP